MKRSYIAIIIVVLLFIVGFTAWRVGRQSGEKSSQTTNAPSQTPPAADQSSNESTTSKSAVKDVATYTLPDGWKEASCDSKPEVVYLLPPDLSVNCNADPSAPISIALDASRTSDCNQLSGNQNVSKHVCKSQNINGSKSLQSSTTYNADSKVAPGMTVSNYFVPVSSSVVKVEYRYSGEAQYQAQFDQIAQSVKAK